MSVTSDPDLSGDPRVLGLIQQCAHDVLAELSELSDRLRTIPPSQLDPRAQPQLHAALRHAETMERMIGGVLLQVTLEGQSGKALRVAEAGHGLLAGRRVLLTDESEDTLRFLGALLSSEGADVLMARTAAQSLDLLAREALDLFVTDMVLRDMSGAQLISALRARPDAWAATPALAMTSDISVQRHDELIAAGANRVVVKPLPDAGEMLRIVARLMRATGRDGAAQARPPEEPVLFDPGPLTRVCRLAGPETGREILDRLILDLVETLARLDRLGTGLQSGGGLISDLEELRATTRVLIALAGTAGALLLLQQVQLLDQRLQDESRTTMPHDLGQLLAEIRLLTRGAVAAIARLPLPGPEPGAGTGRGRAE